MAAQRSRGPGPTALRDAASALLWSRLVVWATALAALALFGRKDGWERFDPGAITTPFGAAGDALVAPAARWDAVWFLEVAADGYAGEARPAFFPLYPLLVRGVGVLTGAPLVVAAVAVSVAAALAGLVVLHRLAALELGPAVARPVVLVTAFFPSAFFLSAVYSESLFLALSAGAFLATRRERFAAAALLGALAAATRSVGVLLVVPLALLYLYPLRDGGVRGPRRRLGAEALWIAAVPLGLAAYCAYLAAAIGDPWAPFAAQDVWLRSFAGPFAGAWDGTVAAWDGVRQLLSGARTPVYFTPAGGDPFEVARRNLTAFAFLAYAAVALAGVLRRLPAAYGAWAIVALALPLSYPVAPEPLQSLPRFVLVLFPLQMWLALWLAERSWTRRGVAVSAALLAVLAGEFAAWEFVA